MKGKRENNGCGHHNKILQIEKKKTKWNQWTEANNKSFGTFGEIDVIFPFDWAYAIYVGRHKQMLKWRRYIFSLSSFLRFAEFGDFRTNILFINVDADGTRDIRVMEAKRWIIW